MSSVRSAPANPFADLDSIALADTLGDLEQLIDEAQAEQKQARAEMTRRGLYALESARFIVVKAIGETHTLDSKAVRREMGDDWYEARQKPGLRTTYTVTAKPAKANGVSP